MKDADSKIIDASFVLSFLLPDEKKETSITMFLKYREEKVDFLSSPILQLEVINGIKSAVKSKRINKKTALALIEDFLEIDIKYPEINLSEIFKLALRENLSIYDSSYVWLSQKENVPLLILDQKMQNLAE